MTTARAILALAAFTLRRIAAGRRFYSALVILSLAPLLAALVCLRARHPGGEIFDMIAIALGVHVAPLLLALVYGISLTTSEIEDGTAGYVHLAAVPRAVVPLVHILVTAAGLAALSGASIAALHQVVTFAAPIGRPPEPRSAALFAAGAGIALLAYLAAVVFCGYAFRRGIAVSVALAVVCEVMVVPMPIKFAASTIQNNVRALLLAWVYGNPTYPPEPLWYNDNWDWPKAGAAGLHLAIVTGTAIVAAMIAARRRGLARTEAG